MVKTLGFHCRAHSLVPGQGTEDLACGMVQRGKKNSKKKQHAGCPYKPVFLCTNSSKEIPF